MMHGLVFPDLSSIWENTTAGLSLMHKPICHVYALFVNCFMPFRRWADGFLISHVLWSGISIEEVSRCSENQRAPLEHSHFWLAHFELRFCKSSFACLYVSVGFRRNPSSEPFSRGCAEVWLVVSSLSVHLNCHLPRTLLAPVLHRLAESVMQKWAHVTQ